MLSPVEVSRVAGPNLREPLHLLEEWLRDSEPVSGEFAHEIQARVETGDLEVLAARQDDRTVGVLVLAFRPSVSLGGFFASIEDLYVAPEARRRGNGKALLQVARERCRARNISYLEVQVEEDAAVGFYEAFGFEREPDVRVFSWSWPLDDRRGEKPPAGD